MEGSTNASAAEFCRRSGARRSPKGTENGERRFDFEVSERKESGSWIRYDKRIYFRLIVR